MVAYDYERQEWVEGEAAQALLIQQARTDLEASRAGLMPAAWYDGKTKEHDEMPQEPITYRRYLPHSKTICVEIGNAGRLPTHQCTPCTSEAEALAWVRRTREVQRRYRESRD